MSISDVGGMRTGNMAGGDGDRDDDGGEVGGGNSRGSKG